MEENKDDGKDNEKEVNDTDDVRRFLEDNNVEQTLTQTVWRQSVRLTAICVDIIEDYVITIWRKIKMVIMRKK
jgi:hypothetical protein